MRGIYINFGTLQDDEIQNISLSDTNKEKFFMLSRLSDFIVCSTSLYIWRGEAYFSGLEK